ncbi:MAG TPA: hypothetical protein VIV60_08730 [Polyangiaceae bacterium]
MPHPKTSVVRHSDSSLSVIIFDLAVGDYFGTIDLTVGSDEAPDVSQKDAAFVRSIQNCEVSVVSGDDATDSIKSVE